MHLGIYRFTGEPAALLAGYDRLMRMIPPQSTAWHLCVVEDDGITIYDTCPSQEAFEAFARGEGFSAALADAGLPRPTIADRPVYAARAGSE